MPKHKDPRITVSLTPELMERLVAAAIKKREPMERVSVSRLVREYIERGLKEDGHG